MQRVSKRQLLESDLRNLIRREIAVLREEADEKQKSSGATADAAAAVDDSLEKDDAVAVGNKLKSSLASVGIVPSGNQIKALTLKLMDRTGKANSMVDFGTANIFNDLLSSNEDPVKIGAAVSKIVATAQQLKNK